MVKIFSLMIILASPAIAVADVYKFVDSDGRVFYIDEPSSNAYKRIIKSKELSYSQDKGFTKKAKEKTSNIPSYKPGKEIGSLSSDSKLSLWISASYKEQANVCESISGVFKNPKLTQLNLCLYLTEMAKDSNADFMKISQVAAIYITVAK
jgi:hypothetical protein